MFSITMVMVSQATNAMYFETFYQMLCLFYLLGLLIENKEKLA